MNRIHFLNGKLVPEEELLISPRDLGFSRGYAVFDFLRTYNHRPFKLNEHIRRLFRSINMIDLQNSWSEEDIKQWVIKTLNANPKKEEKFIKIMVTGGLSNFMLPVGKPTVIILVDPCMNYNPVFYEKGASVTTSKYTRALPAAKTTNYIEGVKQARRMKENGVQESIYYSDEQVYEGTHSNIFAVLDNKLCTPRNNILEGITRSVLLDTLKLNIPIITEDFSLKALFSATEIFLSGSGHEVMPVTQIDGVVVGNGEVGPIAKEAMRQFREYTLSDSW